MLGQRDGPTDSRADVIDQHNTLQLDLIMGKNQHKCVWYFMSHSSDMTKKYEYI